LEDQLLQDSDLADQLELAENDLLDDYARGLLNSHDASRVQQYLLAHPGSAKRLAFATALARIGDGKASAARSWPAVLADAFTLRPIAAYASLAAACLLIGVSVYLLHHSEPSVKQSSAKTGEVAVESSRQPATLAPNAILDAGGSFAIVLLSNPVRGPAGQMFAIPSKVRRVKMQCEVPSEDAPHGYRMVLMDAGGRRITAMANLLPNKTAGIAYIEGEVSASQLDSAAYTVAISNEASFRPATFYHFTVQKQH
jgi:hypothetical protein